MGQAAGLNPFFALGLGKLIENCLIGSVRSLVVLNVADWWEASTYGLYATRTTFKQSRSISDDTALCKSFSVFWVFICCCCWFLLFWCNFFVTIFYFCFIFGFLSVLVLIIMWEFLKMFIIVTFSLKLACFLDLTWVSLKLVFTETACRIFFLDFRTPLDLGFSEFFFACGELEASACLLTCLNAHYTRLCSLPRPCAHWHALMPTDTP